MECGRLLAAERVTQGVMALRRDPTTPDFAAPADLLVPGARATQPLAGLAVGPTAALLGLANCRGARPLLLLQPPPAPPEEIAERNTFIAARLAAYSPPCPTSPSTAATPRRSPAPRQANLRSVYLGVD